MQTYRINVYGSSLEYFDTNPSGAAHTIIFLHGNPALCYCWRKVIPPLANYGRCVAPSLVGFGNSAKPNNIPYSFFNHAAYLEEFIDLLGIKENITLVIQDWGSALGFDYASRHEDRIKGVVFFEAILRPYPSWDVFPKSGPDPARATFQGFRTGLNPPHDNGLTPGSPGWKAIIENSVFINNLLPGLLAVTLPPDEMEHYTAPFSPPYPPESRIPILRFVNEIPIEGKPADMTATVGRYSSWFSETGLPFLLMWSKKGATLVYEHVEWCRAHFRSANLTVHEMTGGVHFFQESNPEEFVRTIERWWKPLNVADNQTGQKYL
jgi:haloalkane dehalogenase